MENETVIQEECQHAGKKQNNLHKKKNTKITTSHNFKLRGNQV